MSKHPVDHLLRSCPVCGVREEAETFHYGAVNFTAITERHAPDCAAVSPPAPRKPWRRRSPRAHRPTEEKN